MMKKMIMCLFGTFPGCRRYLRFRCDYIRLFIVANVLICLIFMYKVEYQVIEHGNDNKVKGKTPASHITQQSHAPPPHSVTDDQKKFPLFQLTEVSGPLTYQNMTSIQQEQLRRRRIIKDRCLGNEGKLVGISDKNWAYDRIVMYNNPNVMYCPALKVGSTFWRRLLYAKDNKLTIHTPFDISITKALSAKPANLLKSLNNSKAATKLFLENSVNMMFVREPYARLLSGYTDKLFAPNPYFWSQIGRFIVNNFRFNASEKSRACGHDVTFREFIQYVAYTEEFDAKKRDHHFTPIYDQCKPCDVKYNVIGKVETFAQDSAYFLRSIGVNISKELGKEWARKAEEDAIFDSTASPFQWKDQIKRCMTMFEAGKRIWRKMQIRGIIDKSVPLPFGSHQIKLVSSSDFIKALIASHRKSTHNKRLQKRQALVDAFSQVSMEDKLKLRTSFMPDFELFDYESTPSDLFDDSVNYKTFRTKYFNIDKDLV